MSKSCQVPFSEVRESLPNDREGSAGPSGSPAVVGRPSRLSRNGREILPDVREPLQDVR